MDVDQALAVMIERLRQSPDAFSHYGYEVYLPKLWEDYVKQRDGLPTHDSTVAAARGIEISGTFYDAAWVLCRKGILRPGVWQARQQVTPDGQGGNGYSHTPMGRRWLEQLDDLHFVPTEPDRIAAMFASFHQRFGDGFHQRAQEAVKCYHALAFLACCAMCGAAAESVLFAAAIARSGDEEKVLSAYKSSNGRSRVLNQLLGQKHQTLASRFRSFMDLINYWRDDSAHGQKSTIGEIEGFDAIGRLLRFAHLVDDHWDELTK